MFNFLKRVTVLSFLVSALAFNANAQSGISAGIGINMSEVDHTSSGLGTDGVNFTNNNFTGSQSSDDAIGLSLNVKYKFDNVLIDNLYVAPSVFFDSIGTSSVEQSGAIYSVESRHGLKFDIGYKVIDNLDAYLSFGVSVVDYQINFGDIDTTAGGNVFEKADGRNSSEIIALGVNYDISDIVDGLSVNFEYNKQSLDLADALLHDTQNIESGFVVNSSTDIETFQLGVSKRF